MYKTTSDNRCDENKTKKKLNNTPKYVSNQDNNRVKKGPQETQICRGQQKITKSSQIDHYLHRSRNRLIYHGTNIIAEKTTIKTENSIYICYTYNTAQNRKRQSPYKNSQKNGNNGKNYYNTAIGHLVMPAKTTAHIYISKGLQTATQFLNQTRGSPEM